MATGPLALSFVRSYVDIDALPFVNAEVALVGRSNVGKSSCSMHSPSARTWRKHRRPQARPAS